jgi:hypothetical protein
VNQREAMAPEKEGAGFAQQEEGARGRAWSVWHIARRLATCSLEIVNLSCNFFSQFTVLLTGPGACHSLHPVRMPAFILRLLASCKELLRIVGLLGRRGQKKLLRGA